MPPGLIFVAQVKGTANLSVDGVPAALKADAAVPQNARINTAAESGVVLVFSNGATLQLGANTELIVAEFLQDPFGAPIKAMEMTEEPSCSRTRLALNQGEVIGSLKALRLDKGSLFIVQSPVGAADVRGAPATFRMAFRASGAAQASFSLACAVGSVSFRQASGSDRGGSEVVVPAGQEIAITVNVTQNAQGKPVVALPAPIPFKPASPAKGP